MNRKPEENLACCRCASRFHDGPCAEQSASSPAQQMPDKESICRAVVDICDRIPGSTAWNAAEFAYDEIAGRLSGSEAVREALEIALPYADDAFEYRHGGTTYFDGPQYRDACIKAIEAAGLKVKP